MALNNVPTPTQTLGQTNLPILQNFQTIDTVFSVNHVAYGASGAGKHALVTFPNLAVPAAPAATEFNLYNATAVAAGSVPQIFLYRGGGSAFPLTQGFQNGTSNGWCYLPSGMKMAWGSGSFTTANDPVLFSTAATGGGAADAFPGFTNPPMVQITRLNDSTAGGGNFVQVGRAALAPTNLQFSVVRAAAAGSTVYFSWLAIGF